MKYSYCLLAGILLSVGGNTVLTGCSEDYSGQIEILYNLIQGTQSRIDKLESQIKELEDKLNNMQPGGDYNELKTEINNLKNQLTQLQNQLNQLKQQTDANTEDIQKLNKELDDLENKVNSLENAFVHRIQSVTIIDTHEGNESGYSKMTYDGSTLYNAYLKLEISPVDAVSSYSTADWLKMLTVKSSSDKGPQFTVTKVTTSTQNNKYYVNIVAQTDLKEFSSGNLTEAQPTNYKVNVEINNGQTGLSRIDLTTEYTQLYFEPADEQEIDVPYIFKEGDKVLSVSDGKDFSNFSTEKGNLYSLSVLGEKTNQNTTYLQIVKNQPVVDGNNVTATSTKAGSIFTKAPVRFSLAAIYTPTGKSAELPLINYITVDPHTSAPSMMKDLWYATFPEIKTLEGYVVVLELQGVQDNVLCGMPGYIAVKLQK